MPCNKPYTAYRNPNQNKSGKHGLVFKQKDGIPGSDLKIACGQCYGCRLEHSRVWAMRNMHEAKLHPPTSNQYLTLTYNRENLPNNNTLIKSDLQKFFKRLRNNGHNIRYYACGEYGDENQRPHYHAIVFNLPLTDKRFKQYYNGNPLYTSKHISKIWGMGFVTIGAVTFESCAYVSRYIMKKRKGKPHEIQKFYERINQITGEVIDLTPEYQTMSRRPGIGSKFYHKYKKDIYQTGTDGQVIIRGGNSCKSPSYYDSIFESESEENATRLTSIKETRRLNIEKRADDNTPARLAVKENIAQHRANKQLIRPLK